jgi:hypothetical protein
MRGMSRLQKDDNSAINNDMDYCLKRISGMPDSTDEKGFIRAHPVPAK